MKETHPLPPVTQAVTQEFQLSITPVGPDTYLLRTEDVAPGVPLAEAQVTWPLETWLAQAEALFQDPLQALLTTPAALPPASDPWTQLGQTLYQGLFQGRIRDSWVAAQGVAQNRRQPLRLRLGFKDSRVQRLPWELLYGDDRPLATGLDVTLCRYHAQTLTDLAAMVPLAPASEPIRLLMIISAPNDQERLALRQEVQSLINNLQATVPGPLTVDLTILEQPGRPELAQALEQGQFHILHYAGHSDAGDTGGDLFLVNRQTGLTERLSGEDLAGLLVNNGVRLAVFNSCRGAYTPHDDAQAGWRDQNLVQALVNRGVPGVVAMAERIPDDVALTFTQLLYRNLHQGHPVDLCLSRVRQGLMSAYGSDQPFWMLPLLYLHPDFDGYLYAAEPVLAKGLGYDDLAEAALMLPDYSSDPEISSLAAEVFTQQAQDTAGDRAAPPLYDWLQDLEQPEPADAAVTSLVQQLSQPQPATGTGTNGSGDRPLLADPTESLLPQAQSVPKALYPPLPHPAADAPPVAPGPPLTWPLLRRWSLPPKLLVWGSLGLAGLGAALGLAIITLTIINRPTVSDPAELPATGDRAGSSASSSALLSGALNAIALGRTDTARTLIEQLLDRNDLTTAGSAVSAIPEAQLLDPDFAYVRGRLAWQQMVAGTAADTSPNDALRAWTQAIEGRPDFLEAWVALGFAHMALNDYDQAIAAWQRAIDIDQRQRRDINPGRDPQVAVPETVNAYAGLALAYHLNSELAIAAEEQAQLQRQAQAYFAQTLALDSTMIDPNALSLNWRWSPTLIGDWQTAVSQLAISSGGAALETKN